MGKAHVAILIPGFNIFGQERALMNVADVLRKEGVEVSILLHETWGGKALKPAIEEQGYRSHLLPLNTIWSVSLFARNPKDIIRNLKGRHAASALFRKIVQEEGISLLLAGNWSFAYYLLPALNALDIGFIYRHGDSPPTSNPMTRHIARSLFRRADRHVANCDFLRRQLRDDFKIEDVTLIRNHPVGIAKVNPAEIADAVAAPNRLVYVGQMSEHKGVIKLLDAFDRLAIQFPDLELILAGAVPGVNLKIPNPVLPRLEKAKEKWGGRIDYRGHVANIEQLFNDRSVHICPSIWDDPSPNVIQEAKALGIPTVGFARGGIPELLRDGVDGRIVREETSEALASAIAELIRFPRKFSSARREARYSLEAAFSYEDHSRAWVKTVERTIQKRGLSSEGSN